MLDIRLIRDNPQSVKAALARVGDTTSVDSILELDARRRTLVGEIEAMRSERNAVSKAVPSIKDPAEKQAKISEMRALGDRLALLENAGYGYIKPHAAAIAPDCSTLKLGGCICCPGNP